MGVSAPQIWFTDHERKKMGITHNLTTYLFKNWRLLQALIKIGLRLRIGQQAVSKWVKKERAHYSSGKFDLDRLS